MTEFKYLQSIVNYRIPIKEDGTLGNPEIESKWTTERGKPKYKPKAKPKAKQVELFKPQETEEVYL